MDENNHKLKILYKCMKLPHGSICCTYHKLKYSSPNHSIKNHPRSQPHIRAYLLRNGGLGNKVRRMGQKQKRKLKSTDAFNMD